VNLSESIRKFTATKHNKNQSFPQKKPGARVIATPAAIHLRDDEHLPLKNINQ
jgi:hypothetical protein